MTINFTLIRRFSGQTSRQHTKHWSSQSFEIRRSAGLPSILQPTGSAFSKTRTIQRIDLNVKQVSGAASSDQNVVNTSDEVIALLNQMPKKEQKLYKNIFYWTKRSWYKLQSRFGACWWLERRTQGEQFFHQQIIFIALFWSEILV